MIGLGYVGLPLAVAIARAGFPVSGFDIEAQKVENLNNGQSYIEAVASTALAGQ
ncbi:MAG: nucleotide sugar dehydrogenase, partial [Mesorhizobium sp.]